MESRVARAYPHRKIVWAGMGMGKETGGGCHMGCSRYPT